MLQFGCSNLLINATDATVNDETMPDVRIDKTSDPKARLAELLVEFRQARQELEEALNEEVHITEWASRAAEKEAVLRAQLGDQLTAEERHHRTNQIPEQQQIEAIHQRRRLAEAHIQALYRHIRPPLSRLALQDPRAKTALEVLDRMPPYVSRSHADTAIGVLEELTTTGCMALPAENQQEASAAAKQGAVGEPVPPVRRRYRGPDLEASRKRIALEEQLRGELASLFAAGKRFVTLPQLKQKFAGFRIWTMLSEREQNELVTEKFNPKAYARSLVLRVEGLTSPETLKKDRRKLRNAAQ
jgi:hypothetical protein